MVACRRAIAALATLGAPPDWAELMAAAAEGALLAATLPASGSKRDGKVGSGGICSLLTKSRSLTSNLLTFRSSYKCQCLVKDIGLCRFLHTNLMAFSLKPNFSACRISMRSKFAMMTLVRPSSLGFLTWPPWALTKFCIDLSRVLMTSRKSWMCWSFAWISSSK